MLQGKTTIELTNVRTGEKERYEEHNMITKALEYLYQPIPNLKTAVQGLQTSYLNYSAQSYEPAYLSLLGGIVLWDKNIEESSEIVTHPHGVKAVGCACYNQVNTTASPKRGSYNKAESSFTNSEKERSMKFVYDFTTNQANGIINCVSLTSWQAGWNGFGGNDDVIDSSGSFMQYGDYHGTGLETPYSLYKSKQGNVFLLDPDEDVFYEITSVTTGAVVIAKYRANLRQRSVFTNVYLDHDLVDTITVNLPTAMSTASSFISNYDIDHNRLYIVVASGDSVAKNSTYYVISIDMDTYNAEVYTLKNNTGNTIYISAAHIICYDGCLYHAYKSNSFINVVSMADGTSGKINIPSEAGTGYVSNSNYRIYIANGMIYFRVRCYRNSNDYYAMAYIDPTDKTIHMMGANNSPYPIYDNVGSYRLVPIKGHPLTFYAESYYSRYDYHWGNLWFNPNYLATINNLARPIEKTSDKTMKITYTIQEM